MMHYLQRRLTAATISSNASKTWPRMSRPKVCPVSSLPWRHSVEQVLGVIHINSRDTVSRQQFALEAFRRAGTGRHPYQQPRDRFPAIGSDSEPDPSPPSSPGSVRGLIEAYSRPRLLSILVEAAAADPALRALLGTAADASPSHCRLFAKLWQVGLPNHALLNQLQ